MKKELHSKLQKDYYNREYASYAKPYMQENWRISYIRRIFNFLDLNQNDIFLDIGVGGSGYTVLEAVKNNIRSIGIDISDEGMRNANRISEQLLGCKSNHLDFIICSATHLPFRNHSISKISAIAVLEHIPNDEQAIKEISRVTKFNGEVFINVPNACAKIPFKFIVSHLTHESQIGHLRHYEAKSLVKMFANFGFTLEYIFGTTHLFKILQIFLGKVCPFINKPNSRIWWKLEELDLLFSRFSFGMQLFVQFCKTKKG